MAAATRHDDQGNAIQVKGKGVGEGEFHDAEGWGSPDNWGPGDPTPVMDVVEAEDMKKEIPRWDMVDIIHTMD